MLETLLAIHTGTRLQVELSLTQMHFMPVLQLLGAVLGKARQSIAELSTALELTKTLRSL